MTTIFLTTQEQNTLKDVSEDRNVYITSLTKEEHNQIIDAHKRKQLEVCSLHYQINCENHLLIGHTNKVDGNLNVSTKVHPFMGQFNATTSAEKQVHYRDYTKTKANQKENAWLINICPDYRVSWKTLMTALGNPEYVLIWWDSLDKKYDHARYADEGRYVHSA